MKRLQVRDEELSAPKRPVGAVTEAVEREPEDRRRHAVLGHARGDVRMVMLHGDRRQIDVACVLRRQILGVQVVRHDLGNDAVQRAKMCDRLFERPPRREVLEVADVVARHDLGPLRDGDRALELRADGEDLHRCRDRQAHRLRCVTAGAAEELHATAGGTRDRVVAPNVNRPVMREESVREHAQPRDRIVVGVGDRLVAEVPARAHDRSADAREEEMVERAVRQEHAELGEAGCDAGCDGRLRLRSSCRREHDRTARRAQCGLRDRVDVAQVSGGVDITHHDCERFVVTRLAPPQLPDRGRVRRVDRQVIPADALHGDDSPGGERIDGGQQRRVLNREHRAVASAPRELRAARRARVGLRVEPPIAGIVVLGAALCAHREAGHRRRGPVVRH